jgi:TonB-dependent receptor
MKRIILFSVLFFGMLAAHAQQAIVMGTIMDSKTKDLLIGASIIIKGTGLGTISDINGNYILQGVPTGDIVLTVSYIGYEMQEIAMKLKKGETRQLNISLVDKSIQTGEVVITAQARGQQAAINQQMNASGIVNVISTEKLQELPDANVAEAIGRLPGLMTQREGGEGQKIVIRGLEPKYNTVAINGMIAPSTDPNDRSTDLNMVAPEIIGGVEVMKAITADKDADGLGGTVNLILKDAPEGKKITTSLQSGYHGQIQKIGSVKGSVYLSNRFFKNSLGTILVASAENIDRSNDKMDVSYLVQGNPDIQNGELFVQPWLDKLKLQSNLVKRTRYNISLNLDYVKGGTKIKTANMLSMMYKDQFIREKQYAVGDQNMRFVQKDNRNLDLILSNSIELSHNFWGTTFDLGGGRSYSAQQTRYNHNLDFRISSPFIVPTSELKYIEPHLVPDPVNINDNIANYYLYSGAFDDIKAPETEWSAWMNWKIPYIISNKINGYVKFGGKFRQKDRDKESKRKFVRFDRPVKLDALKINSPDLELSSVSGYVGLSSFIDDNFSSANFLNGQYNYLNVDYALQRDMVSGFYDTNKGLYDNIMTTMIQNDYTGHEELYAGYIMAELNVGKWFTFTPGLRYDYTFMKYGGFSGDNIPSDLTVESTVTYEWNEESNDYAYWLPQIHLRLKPTNWFDVRLALTQTLSRPDFDLLSPRTQVIATQQFVNYSRTNLRPAKSTNYDAIATFYHQKWGLLTIGGFYKKIDDFIFVRNAVIKKGSDTDSETLGISSAFEGFTIQYPLNNPHPAYLWGIEFDVQTSLKNLDGFWKGIVISANMSFMKSQTKYNETLITRIANPDYGKPGNTEGRFIKINNDTTYTDRLLNQPSVLANVSLGYDYRKFSARLSYSYQDDILITEQHRADGADKETTLGFSKWDLQLNQKISKRVRVFANVSNIFNAPDISVRTITGYVKTIEYYGFTTNLGIKIAL